MLSKNRQNKEYEQKCFLKNSSFGEYSFDKI